MLDANFKKKTAIGLALAAFVVVFSKMMSLSSQWILGFLLEPNDFGVYGLILGGMAFAGAFQSPGLGRLHTQFQSTKGKYWNISIKLSLIFSLIGAFVLVFISNTMYKSTQDLIIMSFIIACSFPLVGFYSLYSARLEVAKNYKAIATYQLISSLVFNCSVVLTAFLGFGAFSFALATLGAAIATASYVLVKRNKQYVNIETTELNVDKPSYYSKVKWSLIGAFLLGFSLRSDYFVVGLTLDAYSLGIYYFGFMLAANIGVVLSQAMTSVLMPAFSSLTKKGGSETYYVNGCRKILLLAIIICFVAMLCISPFVSWVWEGKWDEAIPICQLFLITLPLKLLVPVSLSYLESLGKWKLKAYTLAFDGITVCIACYLGAFWGLQGAAIAVAIQRGTAGLASLVLAHFLAIKKVGNSASLSLLKDILIFCVVVIIGCWLVNSKVSFLVQYSFTSKLIILFVSYLTFSFVVNRHIYKSLYRTALSLLFKR
ncbi:oligosaccharide flippase family protein [Paraglaciecola sp. 2405UD69-4]|uniref:oligosaccharide flippase family protein n=1 Tax=Paraglaciecola sp. 2405UD69-4 TaxID=3391836 RepID=UPI0039C8F204